MPIYSKIAKLRLSSIKTNNFYSTIEQEDSFFSFAKAKMIFTQYGKREREITAYKLRRK